MQALEMKLLSFTSTDSSLSQTQDRRNSISDLKYLAVK